MEPATVASPARVHGLWIAFLAVWAGTLIHYGGVAAGAIAATAAAMAALNLAALALLPGPFWLSRSARWFLAGATALFALHMVPGLGFLFPWNAALRASHGVAGAGPGTADAFLTARQAAQFAAYALAALLVLRLVQAGLPRGTVVMSLLGVLALEGLYALVQTGFGIENIPFYGKRHYFDSASGTLVNRNSFGGMMAMGLALAAGVAWARFSSRRQERGGGRAAIFESGLLWSLAAALFAAGVVLSRSRGGALAAVAGVWALPFLLQRRTRGTAVAGLATLAAVGALTVFAANTEPLLERFQSLENAELSEDTRVVCWKATLEGARRQPVLGFGIGSYPRAFRPFQPPSLPGQFQHAHNEYVNAAFEGGAAWLLLLAGGLALWFVRSIRGLASLHGSDRLFAGAAVAAVAAAAIHALTDFDLRITSVGLLFAACVGLAPAFASSARAFPRLAWAGGALSSASVAALLAFYPLDPEPVTDRAATADPAQAEILLHRALALSPCDAPAAWRLARAAERRGDLDLAAKRFEIAASLWPAHPPMQLQAGLWFWDSGLRAPAAACFRRAFVQSPGNVGRVLDLVWNESEPPAAWEALMPTPRAGAQLAAFLARRGRWQEAADVFNRLVPATKENAPAYDVLAQGFQEAGQWGLEAAVREKRLTVKSDAWAHALAARAWARLEAWDPALENARVATRIDPAKAEWQLLLAEVLEAKGDGMAAAEALTAAIAMEPAKPEHRMRRAALYEREKLFGQAEDDYRAVLQSVPGRRDASIKLARVLAAGGKKAEAVVVLDAVLAADPGDAEAAKMREALRK